MADYLPSKELELQVWLANFLTVATPNIAALGIAAADLTPLQNEQDNFNNALSTVASTRAAAEAAVQSKESVVKLLDRDTRALVRRIQSHAGVSNSLKTQLGINVPSPTRTKTPPVVPAALAASPQASGVNIVTWDRMGNKPSTQFLVYAKPITVGERLLDDSGWAMVGLTTRSKFDHVGVVVGQPMAYRVLAARANQSSAPSQPVTVYAV